MIFLASAFHQVVHNRGHGFSKRFHPAGMHHMQRSIWLLRRGGGPGTVGFGGDLDEDCAGRGSVDHDWIVFGQCKARSSCYVGAAAPEQGVLVATWMKTARAEGSSTMTGSPSGNAI